MEFQFVQRVETVDSLLDVQLRRPSGERIEHHVRDFPPKVMHDGQGIAITVQAPSKGLAGHPC